MGRVKAIFNQIAFFTNRVHTRGSAQWHFHNDMQLDFPFRFHIRSCHELTECLQVMHFLFHVIYILCQKFGSCVTNTETWIEVWTFLFLKATIQNPIIAKKNPQAVKYANIAQRNKSINHKKGKSLMANIHRTTTQQYPSCWQHFSEFICIHLDIQYQ